MKEQFINLTSEEVKATMTPIESEYSHTERVAQSLGQTVFGQEEACHAVARRVALFDAGLNNPERPLGVEMFLGPTGVGKTEMAHALAKEMFDDPDSDQLKIIDCAEFSLPHTVTRLTGAPPSYIGYGAEPLITEDFLSKRNIIVFDEIEKADPELHRLLLGVMEDARMRITGRHSQDELRFNNSLIIMTSNVGTREVSEAENKTPIGFGSEEGKQDTNTKQISTQALKNRFAPEFINRIDDVVVFKNLEPRHYDRIFYKFLTEINHDLERFNPEAPFVASTTEFKDFVVEKIDKQYGARDMRRVLDRELLEQLADIFMGMDMNNRPIVADRENDKTFFYTLDVPMLSSIEKPPYEELGDGIVEVDDTYDDDEVGDISLFVDGLDEEYYIDLEDDVDDQIRKEDLKNKQRRRKKQPVKSEL